MAESDLQEDYHPTGMKYCRTCYNYLAGKVGVLVSERLMENGLIQIGNDTHFKLISKGEAYFEDFGIDIEVLCKKRSRFAKVCIDFTERRRHLGGLLCKTFFDKMEEKG